MPRILIQNQKKLSKEEKENRCQYIAGLFRKGWSKLTITEHISNEWGISKQSAANWIKQTYKYINSYDESFVKNLRRIQLERLELMLMEAMEARNWKVANSIADTINKTMSLYEIKTKVEITDNVVRFKFNDSDEKAYQNIDTELTEEQEQILDESNKRDVK